MKRIEDYGSVMQRMHPSGNCFADAVQRAENGGRRSRISMRLGAGIAAAVVALCVGANVLLFYRMTHMPIGIVTPGVAAALPQVTVQDTADAGAMLNDFYMHLYDENVHDDSLNGKLPDYDWSKTALSISGEWDTEQATVSARAVTGDMYTVIVLYDLTAKTENPPAGWYQQTELPVVHSEIAVHMSYSLPELDLNAVTRHTQQVDAQTVRVMAVYPMPDGDTLIGRDISLCMNGTGAMLSDHSLIIPFLQNCNLSKTGDVPNFGGGEPYRIALNSPVSLKLLTADSGRYGAKHLDRTVDQGCDMLTAAMKDGTEMLLVCDLICESYTLDGKQFSTAHLILPRPIDPAKVRAFYLGSTEIPVAADDEQPDEQAAAEEQAQTEEPGQDEAEPDTAVPEIGIHGVDVLPDIASAYNLPQGVYVRGVAEGSGAEQAGIQQGDVITACGGEQVTDCETLIALREQYAADGQITLTVYRNGKELTVTVVLQQISAAEEPQVSEMGIIGIDLPEEMSEALGVTDGVFVKAVTEGSPAALAGVEAFDVVTALNGIKVQDCETLISLREKAAPGGEVMLTLNRDGEELNVFVYL